MRVTQMSNIGIKETADITLIDIDSGEVISEFNAELSDIHVVSADVALDKDKRKIFKPSAYDKAEFNIRYSTNKSFIKVLYWYTAITVHNFIDKIKRGKRN